MFNPADSYEHTKFSIDHIPIKIELVKPLPDTSEHIVKYPQDYILLGTLAGFFIIRTVFVLVIPAIRKVEIDGEQVASINHYQKIPCKNCRYFINDNYLKCAVHPTVVLTQQALDCSDYWPLKRYAQGCLLALI